VRRVFWRTAVMQNLATSFLSLQREMAMLGANETALEHDFPVAWTFASMILAGGLGWTMLTLVVQA
jgi:hypothetical protein